MTGLPELFAPRPGRLRPPVIFYDGECGLCNRFVWYLIRRDPGAIFQFAPLQGETAKKLLPVPPDNPDDWAIVLVDDTGMHQASDAVLRALCRLGGIWTLLHVLRAVPRPIRDAVYMYVARRRFYWFGKADACPVPTMDERLRFLL